MSFEQHPPTPFIFLYYVQNSNQNPEKTLFRGSKRRIRQRPISQIYE